MFVHNSDENLKISKRSPNRILPNPNLFMELLLILITRPKPLRGLSETAHRFLNQRILLIVSVEVHVICKCRCMLYAKHKCQVSI